jgi:hypothetical protein
MKHNLTLSNPGFLLSKLILKQGYKKRLYLILALNQRYLGQMDRRRP